MVAWLAWSAVVAVAATVSTLFGSATHFAPGACERLEPYLTANIVGQDLALRQITDAICDHLAAQNPTKPLVLSLHGPPGVGKSLFHQLAARALYSTQPHRPDLRCPGPDCAGYKVLFGLDFTEEDRASQHAALKRSLIQHVERSPEAFLVVEEYDKLDCPMRGFLRQMLEGGVVGNVSLSRSVVVLESNTGYMTLHGMLRAARKREAISAEHAQRELKDLVFDRWRAEGCEERTDTQKMVGHVDFFLPFFPLEETHVRQLFEIKLKERSRLLESRRLGQLEWDAAVIEFLTKKVEFEGLYPIEGGKEATTLLIRYVSRSFRRWMAAQEERLAVLRKKGQVKRKDVAPVGHGRLVLDASGERLDIVAAKS